MDSGDCYLYPVASSQKEHLFFTTTNYGAIIRSLQLMDLFSLLL